ncbi:Rgg/GadR/MutR family transcriptional regulator [Streptococcus porcorum]|uniref:Rgg/GadR/MutR family transcriptional activator n=1 Tax=Streptococcus porcorum TaxID=701526 RepID=A0ABV2JE64_9STRE
MGSYGKIFKMIRESKNMSLKEVAGDFVTPAQLSRFENGKSNLSVDTFFHCLKNMDVLQGEFSTFYHSYFQDEDVRLSREFRQAIESRNVSYFQKMIKEYEMRYLENNKKSDRVFIAVLYVMRNRCNLEESIPKEERQIISDYLMSIDEWCFFELWIFGNCSRVLSSKTIEILGSELLHRTQFYNSLDENRKRVYRILLNITGQILDRKEERVAAKFIKYLEQMDIFETDMFERLQLRFIKGHFLYLQGNVQGLEEMKECQKVVDFLDCYNLSKQIEDTIALVTDM